MIPSTHPLKIDQMDSDNKNLGESNMITKKVINDPKLLNLYNNNNNNNNNNSNNYYNNNNNKDLLKST